MHARRRKFQCFEGKEEEWQGGGEGKERERTWWLRFAEKMQEGAAGWERERERKEPVCSPPVHILEPLTDEASPYDWRRVVGLRATSEAPLPCRLGPLLDDYPETRLMGPVGAPEIPTRTGHNARLSRSVLLPTARPRWMRPRSSRVVPWPRRISSPFFLFPFSFFALLSRPFFHASFYLSVSFICPRPPLIPQQAWLPSRLPSSTCSCPHRCPYQWQYRALTFGRPALRLHAMTLRKSKKIDTLESQNDNDKHRFRHFAMERNLFDTLMKIFIFLYIICKGYKKLNKYVFIRYYNFCHYWLCNSFLLPALHAILHLLRAMNI